MANTKNQQTPTEESISKMEAFVLKYKKVISIAVVAVVVVVAGALLLNNFYLKPREVEASTAIAKGQELFAQEQFEKALNGDGAGYIGFLKVIDQYGCTDAGNLAKLYAGLCYAQLGKWQEAADKLDSYSPADDAMVSPAAVAALGNVYVSLNRIDDAVSNLKKRQRWLTQRRQQAATSLSLRSSCFRQQSFSRARARLKRLMQSTRTSRRTT